MRKKYLNLFLILAVVLVSTGTLVYFLADKRVAIEQFNIVDRIAGISPDYCDIIIPPNIAPLNFLVKEEGSYYCAKISSRNGEPIEVFSPSSKIEIPQKSWRKLLNNNKGEER